jgi:hypothetical protein
MDKKNLQSLFYPFFSLHIVILMVNKLQYFHIFVNSHFPY